MDSSTSLADEQNGGHDLEANRIQSAHLVNNEVSSFSWTNLNVTVKDRKTKSTKSILTESEGLIHAGEMLAIMGPSGSGKTTLLNALAHRVAAAGATTTGEILVNGQNTSLQKIRDISSYVEQDDALIGSLTVKETVMFAARLSLPSNISKLEARRRVDDLISSFGLQSRAETIVGTPIKKGLSGGQKKRLSVASRLVTNPKILFLDEPTSGLDSALSLEVCSYIKEIAKKNNVSSITSTLLTYLADSPIFYCIAAGSCLYPPTVVRYVSAVRYPLSHVWWAHMLLWSSVPGYALLCKHRPHHSTRDECRRVLP